MKTLEEMKKQLGNLSDKERQAIIEELRQATGGKDIVIKMSSASDTDVTSKKTEGWEKDLELLLIKVILHKDAQKRWPIGQLLQQGTIFIRTLLRNREAEVRREERERAVGIVEEMKKNGHGGGNWRRLIEEAITRMGGEEGE